MKKSLEVMLLQKIFIRESGDIIVANSEQNPEQKIGKIFNPNNYKLSFEFVELKYCKP
jgi:hypothetical protein